MIQQKSACHNIHLARDWQTPVSKTIIYHFDKVNSNTNNISFTVFRKDCSPGPGYYIDSATTRFGTGGTPSYSILGRQMDPSRSLGSLLN